MWRQEPKQVVTTPFHSEDILGFESFSHTRSIEDVCAVESRLTNSQSRLAIGMGLNWGKSEFFLEECTQLERPILIFFFSL